MDGAMLPTPLPPPATPAHNQNNHGMRFMTSIARYDPQIVMHGPNKHGLRKVFFFRVVQGRVHFIFEINVGKRRNENLFK